MGVYTWLYTIQKCLCEYAIFLGRRDWGDNKIKIRILGEMNKFKKLRRKPIGITLFPRWHYNGCEKASEINQLYPYLSTPWAVCELIFPTATLTSAEGKPTSREGKMPMFWADSIVRTNSGPELSLLLRRHWLTNKKHLIGYLQRGTSYFLGYRYIYIWCHQMPSFKTEKNMEYFSKKSGRIHENFAPRWICQPTITKSE